jgi:Heparinase II/III-like protein/Heparinase II/III N-terminus
MSPSEMGWRTVDLGRQQVWARRQITPGSPVPVASPLPRHFDAVLPSGAAGAVPPAAAEELIAVADAILAGRWTILGVPRKDIAEPDWFHDPVTGIRAPQATYCFRIDHRREDLTGNVKQVWELSRMHHLTVLAAAFALSGDDDYAEAVGRQLRSWWSENPFLSGINWTSGIEVGLRLVAWVWIRRLLEGWPAAPELFENNPAALTQIWWHQRFLAAFRSRGSSANNHVIAEAAGQLTAALAFPWFEQSVRWETESASLLERELAHNTYPSGVNRELASDYHGFVAELGLVAALEADRAGRPLSDNTWRLLGRMLDTGAAMLDEQCRPPRQNDGDDGRALVLGPPDSDRWATLLALGCDLFGAPDWWPRCAPGVASVLMGSMAAAGSGPAHPMQHPAERPVRFDDAGVTILRTPAGYGPEIWCRCDGGPHGFLSIAAHAHADALAVEVRHGGVDVLADPGTYCYHGEPQWRAYFRSTIGHNTLELGGRDQSVAGGPFMWTRHARTQVIESTTRAGADVWTWSAEHDGYSELNPPARHRRTVRLYRTDRRIEIVDRVDSAASHPFCLTFHLGPEVDVRLERGVAFLSWPGSSASSMTAVMKLPDAAEWRVVRGSSDPVLGWYSPRFGEKVPAPTLLGEGRIDGAGSLETQLEFGP